MVGLLETADLEHRRLTDRLWKWKLALWVRDTRNKDQVAQARKDWKDILEGKTFAPQADREARLSDLARLMSRPDGQKLIHDLMEAAGPRKVHLMASPVGVRKGGCAEATKDASGITSVVVKMLPGARDCDTYDEGFVGWTKKSKKARTRKILAPHFIEFGHELIHALRHFTGEFEAAAPTRDDWDTLEEQGTIDTGKHVTENKLRAEHGLSKRYGHHGGAWVKKAD
jgi:hypothetical protein